MNNIIMLCRYYYILKTPTARVQANTRTRYWVRGNRDHNIYNIIIYYNTSTPRARLHRNVPIAEMISNAKSNNINRDK